MQEPVAEARAYARGRRDSGRPIDPDSVRAMFASGTKGDRITALSLMQGDPDLVDLALIVEVMRSADSAFEQTQAFVVAEQLSRDPSLAPEDARLLVAAARAALDSGDLRNSKTRRANARAIVERLEHDETTCE
jgi:hypothetical protein